MTEGVDTPPHRRGQPGTEIMSFQIQTKILIKNTVWVEGRDIGDTHIVMWWDFPLDQVMSMGGGGPRLCPPQPG